MHDAPLFLGLTRPPKIFGLPIGYFVSLMLGSVIPFVGANDWRFLMIGVVGYPVLWFVADRNPNLFETVAVVFSRTPRTRGKSAFSGDRHVSCPQIPLPGHADASICLAARGPRSRNPCATLALALRTRGQIDPDPAG